MVLPRRQRRFGVRVASVTLALLTMYAYGSLRTPPSPPTLRSDREWGREGGSHLLLGSRGGLRYRQLVEGVKLGQVRPTLSPVRHHDNTSVAPHLETKSRLEYMRRLLSTDVDNVVGNGIHGDIVGNGIHGNGSNDAGGDNCTNPRHPPPGYNSSCDFVQQQCGSDYQLFDYLGFVLCSLEHVQPLAYAVLILWLIYLISLLATTADNFFVPPLNLLSEKLRLSPSIAGITLLAIGNGAPDVFTAYAALKEREYHGHEMALVLGALIGASIFISTIVLGTIILITRVSSDNIDKVDFIRDVVAYMCVVALVAAVVSDGSVHLAEAIAFPIFYILYIACVVALGYIRGWYSRRKQAKNAARYKDSERVPLLIEDRVNTAADDKSEVIDEIQESVEKIKMKKKASPAPRVVLLGLTWPYGANVAVKLQWLMELPFSILRWLSVPPCYYDGQWTPWHHWFAVSSPIPMAMVLLITVSGWDGFTSSYVGKLPLFALLLILGFALSFLLFFVLSSSRPPHWTMQIVLGIAAFVMSIAWLNLEANEVVAVLQSLGLLFSVDNAILGLTVLAIGNSVGDWVADTAVARAGKPGMGVASCFGSPLLNDVLGLSVALIARIGVYDHGETFTFAINDPVFNKVKLSWIFLGMSLLSSAVVFPVFKFSPPRVFGIVLIYIYFVFMVFSILDATGVLPVNL